MVLGRAEMVLMTVRVLWRFNIAADVHEEGNTLSAHRRVAVEKQR